MSYFKEARLLANQLRKQNKDKTLSYNNLEDIRTITIKVGPTEPDLSEYDTDALIPLLEEAGLIVGEVNGNWRIRRSLIPPLR